MQWGKAFRLQKNPLPTPCWRAQLVQALELLTSSPANINESVIPHDWAVSASVHQTSTSGTVPSPPRRWGTHQCGGVTAAVLGGEPFMVASWIRHRFFLSNLQF